MKKLNYDKERLAQARDLRLRWYNGEKVDCVPFDFNVTSDESKTWINTVAFNYREMIGDSAKVVEFFMRSMQRHLSAFPDCDFLPCFNTYYFGEGILASMYGAEQYVVEDQPPFTKGRFFKDIYDAQRIHNDFDVDKTEWGAMLREHAQRFVEATDGEIPVGVADYQSPYGTATKLVPNEELMLAMYDAPELVHNLLSVVTDGIIKLIGAMERWVGPECLARNVANPIPGECGVILWDDYVSVLNPALHTEFCAPWNKKLFAHFGKGHLHTCGPYFPSYIDACLACEPRSIDVAIMRDQSKTREDLVKFAEIARAHNILPLGWLGINDHHFMVGGSRPPDEELLALYVKAGHLPTAWGSYEDGLKFKETVRRLSL